jgi:two-component system alkaline phosphatase synthesis response regulator PhoP
MKKKILLGEDDLELVELMKTALEDKGYEVLFATTGADVLRKLKEHKPDLLVLDVLLPQFDGYSIQLELAEDDSFKQLPVIIITSLPSSKKLFTQFLQVKEFFEKPIDMKVFTKRVEEILSS